MADSYGWWSSKPPRLNLVIFFTRTHAHTQLRTLVDGSFVRFFPHTAESYFSVSVRAMYFNEREMCSVFGGRCFSFFVGRPYLTKEDVLRNNAPHCLLLCFHHTGESARMSARVNAQG